MRKVSTEEMVEFFLYATEINSLVANARSRRLNRLIKVITANDLSNINLVGDATFRNALSAASKKATALYPNLASQTLLLNLPKILSALVKLFKPLFPPAVQAKLKFEQVGELVARVGLGQPLRCVGCCGSYVHNGDGDELAGVLYSGSAEGGERPSGAREAGKPRAREVHPGSPRAYAAKVGSMGVPVLSWGGCIVAQHEHAADG